MWIAWRWALKSRLLFRLELYIIREIFLYDFSDSFVGLWSLGFKKKLCRLLHCVALKLITNCRVWEFKLPITYIRIFFTVEDVSPVMLSVGNRRALVCQWRASFSPAAATFGTASMSMPAGFGTPAPYSLPTSFSGSFQQPAFPAQAAFPPQPAFPQQPNGKSWRWASRASASGVFCMWRCSVFGQKDSGKECLSAECLSRD